MPDFPDGAQPHLTETGAVRSGTHLNLRAPSDGYESSPLASGALAPPEAGRPAIHGAARDLTPLGPACYGQRPALRAFVSYRPALFGFYEKNDEPGR